METNNMIEGQEVLVTLGASAFEASLAGSIDRLSAAAVLLEKAIARFEERQPAVAGEVPRVVAAVESPVELLTQRETELERRLEEAENQIVELRAQSARPAPARKTLPAIATSLLAKQGLHGIESIEAGALDAALAGLSLEQRIAVKSQLLRAGALV